MVPPALLRTSACSLTNPLSAGKIRQEKCSEFQSGGLNHESASVPVLQKPRPAPFDVGPLRLSMGTPSKRGVVVVLVPSAGYSCAAISMNPLPPTSKTESSSHRALFRLCAAPSRKLALSVAGFSIASASSISSRGGFMGGHRPSAPWLPPPQSLPRTVPSKRAPTGLPSSNHRTCFRPARTGNCRIPPRLAPPA